MNKYQPYRVVKPASLKSANSISSSGYSFRRFFTVFVIFLILGVGIMSYTNQRATAKAAQAAETARRISAINKFNVNLSKLAEADPLVDYSISISDEKYLKNSEYNSMVMTDAASTAKLLSASLYLTTVEQGHNSLSQIIQDKKADAILQSMIQMSDDTAWEQVNSLLSHKALQNYANGLGLTSYNVESNQISAADMNRFTKLLTQGKLLNSSHTKLLMSYMQHTNYENFMAPAVDKVYSFYHKVGLNEDEVNETAAIVSDQDTLFVTIYSNGNGSYNWPQRATQFQQIVKAAINAYLN